jgi:Flp pilus assembly protein TadD
MAGNLEDAVVQLERARELDPRNAAIYSNLAKAYQRRGDSQHAQEMLTELAKLNQEKAEKIGAAPGDRKASYAGVRLDPD